VPKLNPNTPTFMDGEVRLFKRKHSKVWQIAFTLDGRQVRVSSKKRILNDAMLMGKLSGIEMALSKANVPHSKGGTDAAMAVLAN
jgi:hypothetical protein